MPLTLNIKHFVHGPFPGKQHDDPHDHDGHDDHDDCDHSECGLERKVDQLIDDVAQLRSLIIQETKVLSTMPADLTDLTNQVAKNTDVSNSAITLIQGLAAQLQAAVNDPAAIQAIVDSLNASDTSLAAAVAANTPGASPAARKA